MNGGKGESILTFQNEILSRNEIVLHIITEKIVNSNFLVLTYLQTDKKLRKNMQEVRLSLTLSLLFLYLMLKNLSFNLNVKHIFVFSRARHFFFRYLRNFF